MCQARSCFASHFSLTVEGSLGVIGGRATASFAKWGEGEGGKENGASVGWSNIVSISSN